MDEIKTQVTELLARVCGEPLICGDDSFELLDSGLLDSLAMITLLAELEDTLGVEIPPSQVSRECWRTPKSIVALVVKTKELTDF